MNECITDNERLRNRSAVTTAAQRIRHAWSEYRRDGNEKQSSMQALLNCVQQLRYKIYQVVQKNNLCRNLARAAEQQLQQRHSMGMVERRGLLTEMLSSRAQQHPIRL